MSLSGQFYVRPAAGELIRAVFAPEPDDRAILLGRLTDGSGMPVEDGAVLLFRDGMEQPELLGRTVTDRDGMFLFGPLESGILYVVQVFKNGLQERNLELKSV